MATFLDIAFLEKFTYIFTFLLVYSVLLGILVFTKVFQDNKVLQYLLPAIIAILVSFSPAATGIIKYITPWFVVIFFFILFLLIAYKLFGVTDQNIADVLRKNVGLSWAIFIVGGIILLSAFAANLGKTAFPYLEEGSNTTTTANGESPSVATSDVGKNVAATIFHPKVLGMLTVLLIAVATIGLLGGRKMGHL